MDWERTKTIFIIAFLLLNSVFVFQILQQSNAFNHSSLISLQIEDTLAELSYRDITVEPDIPSSSETQQILHLTRVDIGANASAAILGADQYVEPGHSARTIYGSDRGEVEISEYGVLTYQAASPAGGEIGLQQAQLVAEEFINSTIGLPADAYLAETVERKDGWMLVYKQLWQGKTLETSILSLQVAGDSVSQMTYYWVEVEGLSGPETSVVPAVGALTVAADDMARGTIVTKIYLSWYSRPVLDRYYSAYPMWVLVTDSGEHFYVNAFTGELVSSVAF